MLVGIIVVFLLVAIVIATNLSGLDWHRHRCSTERGEPAPVSR